MSSFLYRLGRSCYRHHRRVLALWLAVLVVLGGVAGLAGGTYSDNFSIPGAPSQVALDKLNLTFPQAAALSADAVVVLPSGMSTDDAEVKADITQALKDFGADPAVDSVTGPYDKYTTGLVNDRKDAAMIQLQLNRSMEDLTDEDRARLVQVAQRVQSELPSGSRVSMGGQAYSVEVPEMSATEGIGLLVALVVLFLTLGSALAAGVPLLTAVVGVAVSMALLMIAARLSTVNSTTPLLAVMLGLAVGIDYALFILSRHRDQLAEQGEHRLDAEESTARAVATAGSAVVFAGLTVCIALVGLTLANIPFLGIMGVFASVAVALAVVIALTLLPALMGFLGERMRPRPRRRTARRAPRRSFFDRWVAAATKLPVLTVVVIVAALGALSYPASNLQMSLPNSGQHEAHQPDRIAYDLVSEHFGPGYNGPLIVTADLLQSTDPMGVMNKLRADIEAIEGVDRVLAAVPNQNADTGIVQVVPTTGPDDPATADLVERITEQQDAWRVTPGVETAVTGSTAIQVDVSERLAKALLPFGIFVVGLSTVLLMMVFRSIWVPVKATLGYLLSVGAAFGATQLVFNEGIGRQVINLEKADPIISFMPIVIMGILFGLAMDYEVFLVSRMREDYVHALRADPDGDKDQLARQAVRSGFNGSAKVVTAAAVIMFAVFAFFVPEGMGPVKQIAFGLAVGVAVDAFIVRMTLVPAVMQLLGARAWHLPAWLDKRLPVLDVEGEGLHRELELADWPTPEHTEALHVEDLAAEGIFGATSLHLEPGQVAVVQGDAHPCRAMLLALSGRLATEGRARVAGHLLPERATEVRRETAFIDADSASGLAADLASALRRAPRVVLVDGADTAAGPALDRLDAAVREARAQRDRALVLGVSDEQAVARWQPDHVVRLVTRHSAEDPSSAAPRQSDTPAPQETTDQPTRVMPRHQLTESL
ncbi:MMPL family transporter [Luteococcus peritonei]|uniref:MMPL family transporter n=1 Tax=Luteococcus peritonei TaxID=88874 RepID=A0ABW4S0R6_9ACTN